jgi:hypothetical protein
MDDIMEDVINGGQGGEQEYLNTGDEPSLMDELPNKPILTETTKDKSVHAA